MWIAAHRSLCALSVATALTVGVVSAPSPAVTHQATVPHIVQLTELTLTSSSSPIASSSANLAGLPNEIDRALRTGLFIVLSPVVVPIIVLGFFQGVACAGGGCGSWPPPLFALSEKLSNFFFPPSASASAAAVKAASLAPKRELAPSTSRVEPAAPTASVSTARQLQTAVTPGAARPAKSAGKSGAKDVHAEKAAARPSAHDHGDSPRSARSARNGR